MKQISKVDQNREQNGRYFKTNSVIDLGELI